MIILITKTVCADYYVIPEFHIFLYLVSEAFYIFTRMLTEVFFCFYCDIRMSSTELYLQVDPTVIRLNIKITGRVIFNCDFVPVLTQTISQSVSERSFFSMTGFVIKMIYDILSYIFERVSSSKHDAEYGRLI